MIKISRLSYIQKKVQYLVMAAIVSWKTVHHYSRVYSIQRQHTSLMASSRNCCILVCNMTVYFWQWSGWKMCNCTSIVPTEMSAISLHDSLSCLRGSGLQHNRTIGWKENIKGKQWDEQWAKQYIKGKWCDKQWDEQNIKGKIVQ